MTLFKAFLLFYKLYLELLTDIFIETITLYICWAYIDLSDILLKFYFIFKKKRILLL